MYLIIQNNNFFQIQRSGFRILKILTFKGMELLKWETEIIYLLINIFLRLEFNIIEVLSNITFVTDFFLFDKNFYLYCFLFFRFVN